MVQKGEGLGMKYPSYMNILSIDVEDYYQGTEIKNWESCEDRVVQNTHKILNMLSETNTKATFFVLGKEYFERKAEEFDELYDNQGSFFQMMVNKIFRKGLYEQAYIALKECGDVRGKRILDVGCGSGRISIPLAERGVAVIGIDYSISMLNLARNFAKERDEMI